MNALKGRATTLSSEHGEINCFDIEVFRLNQRQSVNPKYDEIKASIRKKGVQDPLCIVHHPDLQSWVLSQGGQTRLRICRELYEETRSDIFLYPPVIKLPFTSDLDLCISHLIENTIRGENTFLETAKAVFEIRNLLTEASAGTPTQGELAESMNDRGLPIRRQSITSMLYLVDELATEITNQAFLDQVSRNMVDGIRSLRKSIEGELAPDLFDSQLIDFINSHSGGVTVDAIKKHFLGNPSSVASEPFELADQVSSLFGLNGVIRASSDTNTGFVVSIPFGIDDQSKAEACLWLADLSGAFDAQAPASVMDQMGISADSGCDPSPLVAAILQRLKLSDANFYGLLPRVLSQTDGDDYNALIQLVSRVGSKVNKRRAMEM